MLAHFITRSVRETLAAPLSVSTKGAAPVSDARLDAAAAWLLRSIDACHGRGSSKGYRFAKGWMPPYPETSGYIIPTLLALAREKGDARLATLAGGIGRWLIEIQRTDGGFSGREVGVQSEPDVFDTGMILLGLNALIHQGDGSFTPAARAAAEFLVASMDERGCFVRHMSHDILHAYNLRSAWALMALGRLVREPSFEARAMDCARWTISRQNSHGFYLENNFKPGGNANTHGTAYVMRGLLQIHYLSGDEACLASVRRAADEVCGLIARHNWIAAELGPQWEYRSKHACLTGYAQVAIILYRLFVLTDVERCHRTADQLLALAASHLCLEPASVRGKEAAPWHGAIPGSFPIYGGYAPLQYPNWATKFFIDAILAQRFAARAFPTQVEAYPLLRR